MERNEEKKTKQVYTQSGDWFEWNLINLCIYLQLVIGNANVCSDGL